MTHEAFTEAELDLVRKRLESGVYVGEDHHVSERLRLLATIAAKDEQITQLKMEIDCMTPGTECSRPAVTQVLCNHHFRRIKIAEQDERIERLTGHLASAAQSIQVATSLATSRRERVAQLEAALLAYADGQADGGCIARDALGGAR